MKTAKQKKRIELFFHSYSERKKKKKDDRNVNPASVCIFLHLRLPGVFSDLIWKIIFIHMTEAHTKQRWKMETHSEHFLLNSQKFSEYFHLRISYSPFLSHLTSLSCLVWLSIGRRRLKTWKCYTPTTDTELPPYEVVSRSWVLSLLKRSRISIMILISSLTLLCHCWRSHDVCAGNWVGIGKFSNFVNFSFFRHDRTTCWRNLASKRANDGGEQLCVSVKKCLSFPFPICAAAAATLCSRWL